MIPPRHTRFESVRLRLEALDLGTGWRLRLYEILLLGFKQGWACLFGGLLLALLLGTYLFYPDGAPLHRYDFLTLAAITIQAGMLAFRLETWREARVILIFHVVGTVMELFKTEAGSWTYPKASLLHIGAVPLFSGFMYAAVGSYIARVWRTLDFRYTGYPSVGAPKDARVSLGIGGSRMLPSVRPFRRWPAASRGQGYASHADRVWRHRTRQYRRAQGWLAAHARLP